MLQLRRWQEKTQKPKNSSLRSGGSTGKVESGRWLFSSSALGAVSLEEKLALAKARRDGQRAEKIRRKLTNMRTECPLYLCRAYGLVDSQGNSILARSSYDDYSDSEYASLASSDEDIPHSRRSSGEAFASASAPAVSFSRKTLSRNTNRMTTRGTIFGQAGRKSAARKTIGGNADRARQEALARKVKKCKAIMRASVQWLKILFRKRRLHRAADACLVLLRHLGEWVHIRSAMKGFLQRVKTIQRTIREFLAIKHKRCHLIEKEWCRIEDQHLSVHAQHKVEIAMQETSGGQTRGPGRGKRRVLQAALEANVSSKNWKMVVDISSQRIPTAERKAIISAYHRRTLKRHMQIGKSFLQIVFDALHASRELDHYLNQFHYGNNARETLTLFEIKREDIVLDQQAQDLPYWHMAEAVILQLVACSAQALAHLPAFKEHPANHAIPADKRSSWLEYSPGFSPHEFAEFVLVQLAGGEGGFWIFGVFPFSFDGCAWTGLWRSGFS
ncbi:RP2 [Symbiodinium sp. KB8]|nr:RP2 [Symbiodinium sp. KB8]